MVERTFGRRLDIIGVAALEAAIWVVCSTLSFHSGGSVRYKYSLSSSSHIVPVVKFEILNAQSDSIFVARARLRLLRCRQLGTGFGIFRTFRCTMITGFHASRLHKLARVLSMFLSHVGPEDDELLE